MADGSDSERPNGDGRLWTDPREVEEHQPWLVPRRPIVPMAPLRAPDEPDPGEDPSAAHRRFVRRALLAALAILLIIGAGLLGNSLLGGDDASPRAAALPVIKGAAPADARTRSVRAIYAAASPSVVFVRVDEGAATDSGTGFFVDGRHPGTIVTNAHVVGSAKQVKVSLDDQTRVIDATVAGVDESSDLAVLKVDPSAVPGRRPLALAQSNDIQVGDLAVAIGYPLGLHRTATAGIVSGVARSITAPNNFEIDKAIQTDAPINPGNSGGPLLDSAGHVIGINSQIATAGGGGGNVGIGFAIPSDTVREVVPQLERGANIRYAFLGAATKAAPSGTGALVGQVVSGGPGQAGGLRVGDVITKIDGRPVAAPEDVAAAIVSRKPGDTAKIEVRRDGSTATLSVTLGTRPKTTP